MQSLSPYSEGSENEKKLIDFIQTRLTLLEIPFKTISFDKSKNSYSFSKNIEARIIGKKPEAFVICVPINAPSDTSEASDNYSINIALALSLLKYFKQNAPTITVKTVFLGAEFGDTKQYPLGTKLFLDSFYPEYRHFFLYLNLYGVPDKLTFETGSSSRISPAWIVQRLFSSLQKYNIPFSNVNTANQMYRTGLMQEKTVVSAYLNREYPAIGISGITGNKTDAEKIKFLSGFQASITDFAAKQNDAIPDDWDLHYLILDTPFFPIIVPETVYVVVVSILFVLFILVGFLRREMMFKYFRTMINNIWNIPLFFIFAFIVMLCATYIIEGLLYLVDLPVLWRLFPILFLVLKMGIFLFLSGIVFKVLQQSPFSKNGSFFSVSALFFTIISLFIISIINISFSYYFIWSLIFITLFTLSRKKFFKILFFVCSPLLIIAMLYDIFSIPLYKFCEIILFNKIAGNLLVVVIVLPFVLLLIRIRLLFRYHTRFIFSSRTIIFTAVFFLISSGIVITMFLYSPYNVQNPAPINISRTIDYDTHRHFLSFSSPARLPVLSIDDPDFSGTIAPNSRNYSMLIPSEKDYFSYKISEKSFLNRKNVRFTITPKGNPEYIEAVLTSTKTFVLYDSNFPFTKSEDANSYVIHIGANWPKNMPIMLTLPPHNVYDLSITLRYKNPPDPVTISNATMQLIQSMTFRKTIHFSL